MEIEKFLVLSIEQLNTLQTLDLSSNGLDNLDEASFRILCAEISKCQAL